MQFRSLSLKATDVIAQRESPGKLYLKYRSLEASNNERNYLFVAYSDEILIMQSPSDARWAIMFVAAGDKTTNIFANSQLLILFVSVSAPFRLKIMKFLNFQKFIVAIIFLAAFGAEFSICAQSDAGKRTEVFDEVWNAINEKYYDANFNGVDWNAVGKKYRARLEKVSDEKSFYILLDQMAGELRDSHTRVFSPIQREQRKKQTRARFGISIKKIENV